MIGPVLLLLFLLASDLERLLALLLDANPWPIVLSLIFIFPFLFIKSWRWQRILAELAIDLPLRTATGLYTVGVYLGSITPGQSGDLMKAWYVRQRGYNTAPALLSVVIDRLCDLIVMALFATLGVVALGQLLPDRTLQTGLVLTMCTGIIGMTVVLAARRPRHWMLSSMLPRVLPARLHPSLERWQTQLATLDMHPKLIVPVSLASLLSAFFTFFRLWLLFLAAGIALPFSVIVGVSALIAVLQIVPISIAGVGVRDAVLIAVLTAPPYLYSQEQALSVSLLFLLLTLEHVVVGFIVSFWFPLVKEEKL